MVPGAVAQVNNQYLLSIIPIARSTATKQSKTRLLRCARNDSGGSQRRSVVRHEGGPARHGPLHSRDQRVFVRRLLHVVHDPLLEQFCRELDVWIPGENE